MSAKFERIKISLNNYIERRRYDMCIFKPGSYTVFPKLLGHKKEMVDQERLREIPLVLLGPRSNRSDEISKIMLLYLMVCSDPESLSISELHCLVINQHGVPSTTEPNRVWLTSYNKLHPKHFDLTLGTR